MRWALSRPTLVVLALLIAWLVWSDRRWGLLAGRSRPWAMSAMGLVAAGMVVALLGVPAPAVDRALQVALAALSVYGFVALARSSRREDRDRPR